MLFKVVSETLFTSLASLETYFAASPSWLGIFWSSLC